ncbi:hypothetical protein D1AOALGA4SA_8540 [Olavius algarvensis Delta 1 endosymbiont]|nr:hypothetical protein D1AOALGA4SA_8540 [Olavius algarvensis Delta 1 endosymbiont]
MRIFTFMRPLYIRDMNFALDYAKENRRIIMERFSAAFQSVYEAAEFGQQVNIHL